MRLKPGAKQPPKSGNAIRFEQTRNQQRANENLRKLNLQRTQQADARRYNTGGKKR